MSMPSVVVQPLMLATNMGGKLVERFSTTSVSRFEEPLVTVTGAQFMYISRLPIRLNQVQASVYLPVSMPSGMAKSKWYGSTMVEPPERLPVSLAGHPPSKDLMTFHEEVLVGCRSVVRLIWHEPPPWVALPMKASFWDSPMGMMFCVVTSQASERSLQGKSLPSAASGELLSESLL